MRGIAKFSKVSFDEFMVGIVDALPEIDKEEVEKLMNELFLMRKKLMKFGMQVTLVISKLLNN